MNIAIQNYPIKTNYNNAFKSKPIAIKTASGIVTGAALTTAAAVLTRPLHEAAKQQLAYTPEDNFSEKSAAKSWCDFYYGYIPQKVKPYTPEDNFSEKSANDSVQAFINGSKLTGTDILRDAKGRIIKIVKEYEPAYTITKNFEYDGSNDKSVTITTDYSCFSLKEVQKYENGVLVEEYSLNKDSEKYHDRVIYSYDTKGRIAKRLYYTSFGYFWTYEYKYDLNNRISDIKLTQSSIPKEESALYCNIGNDKNMYITNYKYLYIKDAPKLIKRDTTYIKPNGEIVQTNYPIDDDNPDEGFFDPNLYVKLTKNKLNQ